MAWHQISDLHLRAERPSPLRSAPGVRLSVNGCLRLASDCTFQSVVSDKAIFTEILDRIRRC